MELRQSVVFWPACVFGNSKKGEITFRELLVRNTMKMRTPTHTSSAYNKNQPSVALHHARRLGPGGRRLPGDCPATALSSQPPLVPLLAVGFGANGSPWRLA